MERSGIPDATEEKFDLAYITVVAYGYLCQALGMVCFRRWMSTEGWIWVYDWLGFRSM